jgi:NAD-dependent SIR2 family protein deacetylase
MMAVVAFRTRLARKANIAKGKRRAAVRTGRVSAGATTPAGIAAFRPERDIFCIRSTGLCKRRDKAGYSALSHAFSAWRA